MGEACLCFHCPGGGPALSETSCVLKIGSGEVHQHHYLLCVVMRVCDPVQKFECVYVTVLVLVWCLRGASRGVRKIESGVS